MKRLFFILLFSLIGSLVYAQRTVTGTVTNEDNFPLSGVIITEKEQPTKAHLVRKENSVLLSQKKMPFYQPLKGFDLRKYQQKAKQL